MAPADTPLRPVVGATDAYAAPPAWPAAWALCRRELVRFLRQRNRVIGAIGTPVVFWLVLGLGLDRAFVAPSADTAAATTAGEGVGYLAYFLPGSAVLIAMFTAIFATIGVIEDRREGFLQGVVVSPTPRWALVFGKVLGGAVLAGGQAALFLAVWPWVAGVPGVTQVLAAAVGVALVSLQVNAFGLAIAWPMSSTAGYHAVMNLVMMPAWLVSGAVFPMASAPPVFQAVMWLNPLTYAHAAIAGPVLGDLGGNSVSAMPWPVAVGATAALTFAALAWAVRVARREGG